jgi:hypothetical protein
MECGWTAANLQHAGATFRQEVVKRNRVVGIEIKCLNEPILRSKHDQLAMNG